MVGSVAEVKTTFSLVAVETSVDSFWLVGEGWFVEIAVSTASHELLLSFDVQSGSVILSWLLSGQSDEFLRIEWNSASLSQLFNFFSRELSHVTPILPRLEIIHIHV